MADQRRQNSFAAIMAGMGDHVDRVAWKWNSSPTPGEIITSVLSNNLLRQVHDLLDLHEMNIRARIQRHVLFLKRAWLLYGHEAEFACLTMGDFSVNNPLRASRQEGDLPPVPFQRIVQREDLPVRTLAEDDLRHPLLHYLNLYISKHIWTLAEFREEGHTEPRPDLLPFFMGGYIEAIDGETFAFCLRSTRTDGLGELYKIDIAGRRTNFSYFTALVMGFLAEQVTADPQAGGT